MPLFFPFCQLVAEFQLKENASSIYLVLMSILALRFNKLFSDFDSTNFVEIFDYWTFYCSLYFFLPVLRHHQIVDRLIRYLLRLKNYAKMNKLFFKESIIVLTASAQLFKKN